MLFARAKEAAFLITKRTKYETRLTWFWIFAGFLVSAAGLTPDFSQAEVGFG